MYFVCIDFLRNLRENKHLFYFFVDLTTFLLVDFVFILLPPSQCDKDNNKQL